ncbi:MAG: hypothetical protein LBE67_11750 [Kocuria palustris]|nr:hypothetical protein [Kocuria palustris]
MRICGVKWRSRTPSPSRSTRRVARRGRRSGERASNIFIRRRSDRGGSIRGAVLSRVDPPGR